MKKQKEIRERIESISKKLKKKIKYTDKEAIKGLMLLSERYALWWVLEEVRKHQRGIKYENR